MATTLKELTLFISCPEELAAERDLVLSDVDELNTIFKKTKGVIINAIYWKTAVVPGIGTEPQAVINDQIGEYDIFLGLMGTRFGSPTKQFGSGTQEEFEIAYKKAKDRPRSVWVLFYFKNSTDLPLDKLDTNQLAAVQKFKSSLGSEKGVLYWSFGDPDVFLKTVKEHLAKLIMDEWQNDKWKPSDTALSSPIAASTIGDVAAQITSQIPLPAELATDDTLEEDFGILEVLIQANAAMSEGTSILNGFANKMTWLTGKIEERTRAMGTVGPTAEQMVVFVDQTAADLNEVTKVLREGIPVFDRKIAESLTGFQESYCTYLREMPGAAAANQETIGQLTGLPITFRTARDQITTFRNQMAGLPRLTKKFRVAQRRLVAELDSLRASITVMISRVENVIVEVAAANDEGTRRYPTKSVT